MGIPCINKHKNLLHDLIININEQILLPNEIIISLSETTDKDGEELQNNLNKISDTNVRIISSDKKIYASSNRNICADNCNTDIITYIDADDLMCPMRIKILEDIYNEYYYDAIYHNFEESIKKCSVSYNKMKFKKENKDYYIKIEEKMKSNPEEAKKTNYGNDRDFGDLGLISHVHLTIKTDLMKKYKQDINNDTSEGVIHAGLLVKNDLKVLTLPDFVGTIYRKELSESSN